MLPTAAHGRTSRFETADTNGTAPIGDPAGWVVTFHDGVSLVLESTIQRTCVENHAPQSSIFSAQLSQHKRTTSGTASIWDSDNRRNLVPKLSACNGASQ